MIQGNSSPEKRQRWQATCDWALELYAAARRFRICPLLNARRTRVARRRIASRCNLDGARTKSQSAMVVLDAAPRAAAGHARTLPYVGDWYLGRMGTHPAPNPRGLASLHLTPKNIKRIRGHNEDDRQLKEQIGFDRLPRMRRDHSRRRREALRRDAKTRSRPAVARARGAARGSGKRAERLIS